MTNLKTLSNAKGIQGQIITIVTPLAKEIAQRQLAFMKVLAEKNNQVFIVTEFGIEMAELSAVVDLFKAVGKYLLTTDTLVSMDVFSGTSGVEINAIIARDGEQFKFNTNAIWAGGYNIQCEHLRYLVKTDLPKGNDKAFAQEVIEAHKAMTKLERLQKELNNLKTRVAINNKEIANAKSMTDAQIANYIIEKDYLDGAWYWTAEFDAASTKLSESEFNQMMAEGKERKIDFWKEQNINWKVENNKLLSKSIAKQEKKIETLK